MEQPPGHPSRSGNKQMSREVVLALARTLGLPPGETDFFLWKMGHAPIEDWQARALAAERLLRAVLEAP